MHNSNPLGRDWQGRSAADTAGLPQELLAVLPNEPSAQLDLANRICAHAFQQQVRSLETRNAQLAEALTQKEQQAALLEQHNAALQRDMQQLQMQMKGLREDCSKLEGEKMSMLETINRLNRDVTKLQRFKKNLLQTLQDSDQGDVFDIGSLAAEASMEQVPPNGLHPMPTTMPPNLQLNTPATHSSGMVPHASISAYSHNNYVNNHMNSAPHTGTTGSAATTGGGSGLAQGLSQMHMSSMYTNSTAVASPPATPSSSSQASAGSRGHMPAPPTRIDGKEFFRRARARLSYEQFSNFLANIKELNGGSQTREHTLQRARDIFGDSNADLYESFEGLLSRHLHPMT